MKIEIQSFKKSINDSNFSNEQIAMIWDFYVTKSIAETAGQKRNISDYNQKKLPWSEMLDTANIDANNVKVLTANSINKTLSNLDLEITEGTNGHKRNKPIEIDIPKIVCLTPYTIADEELPKAKVGTAESVLTHIRNAFAHGNTYFFDNGMVLLEDKDRSTITARILIKCQTLLDWIKIIDHEERYYVIRDNISHNPEKMR